MAGIVDRPKEFNQDDLLEIEKYTNGLIRFIGSSETPITIGIQGEWGSGKTSLMNTIKEDLCDKEGAKYYPVWINTWEYSLLSTPEETLIKIISGLIVQISELTKNNTSEKAKKAIDTVGTLLTTFGNVFGGVPGKIAEVTGDALKSTVNEPQDNSVKALRIALQQVIDEAIKSSEKNFDKDAFIFFIDDLDRLDPAVAVSILELIKNLFDLKNCVFVLAIDYGVVVKGLQSKFGVMTEENEWEFRAFFDKIIQLPFSMPISGYNISKYLKALLVKANYFTASDLNDKETLLEITEAVGWSVGTNPRALIRLANSASLVENVRGDDTITHDERVIEFALICIQIAYPSFYSLIQKKSDFTSWDSQFAYEAIKNKNIDEKDLEVLKSTDEFNDEWEQAVWKICQINSFLKQKTYQISKILNYIDEKTPENISETLDKLLSMSSVTSVSTDNVVLENRTKRVDKKIQAYAIPMQKYIGDELSIQYPDFAQSIKLNSKRKTGNLYLMIKKGKLDFDFCIWTNYKRIDIYVNTRNKKNLNKVKKWFEEHMRFDFPKMKLSSENTRLKVVVLDSIVMDDGLNQKEALEQYKKIVGQTFNVFLPKISKYTEQ